MKNITKYISVLFIGGLMVGCTNNFEDANTDKTAFTETQKEYDYMTFQIPLKVIQQGIYFNYSGYALNWPWQIIQNLNGDLFSGYFNDYHGTFETEKNASLILNDGWTNQQWIASYTYIMPSVADAEKVNAEREDFMSVTKILKVALLHQTADYYGPIVYSNYGGSNAPESLKDVYRAMVNDLGNAISTLKEWIADGKANTYTADILTPNKTYADWLKFANSLRLRLAMRTSNVDKEFAKSEVQKCMDCGQFLDAVTPYIAAYGGGYLNPLGIVGSNGKAGADNQGWHEVMLNATMECYLKGYEDPRLNKYFLPALGGADKGNELFDFKDTFQGMRQSSRHGDDVAYTKHSECKISSTDPAYIMTYAETCFLRAEAALRNYTNENAEELYKEGVTASFKQWEAGDATAYLNSENIPSSFRDTYDSKRDYTLKTKVSPKWDNTLSQEQKLEKIITQKWLAMFPQGNEAWAEQRRTGYPEIVPAYFNASNGLIDEKIGPRRLIYPQTNVKDNDPTLYAELMKLLNGADNGATRLWWDAGENNF